MRKLVQGLVKDQLAFAERERQEAAWGQRELSEAPALTVSRTRMLR